MKNTPVNAWEKAYTSRGRLYGGSPPPLPALPPQSRVLEIGCGDGKGLSCMLIQDWDVTAIDSAPAAIKLCLNLKGRETARGLFVADVIHLPFRPASFDVIFCTHILGHLDDHGRRAGAAESGRVLDKGGYLFFRGFSKGDMRASTGTEIEPGTRLRDGGIRIHYFTVDEITSLFSPLIQIECMLREWNIRIRGKQYRRSEVVAVFRKQ